ncbi:ethylene-responsive transcription factor ERF017-like [Zingiber officinale]|uniref:AP2/ERF domain-containing protein n=1 Tax=Zingiber officinale TaxID=94328 RepID=A0A8J5H727_ZINOF|nr:ethylene-responsive transcription factor ERF017-like [Zingiber officinale]KAG6520414.1 hypothetical protein ZIOFF_017464 [Zingiber officinale]
MEGSGCGGGSPGERKRYRGVRRRKWGAWVAEVRFPNSRERLWLGSYCTAEEAARAFDAALYCLRGPGAEFNFPDSPPDIPFAAAGGMSREEIRATAIRFAHDGGSGQQTPPQEAVEITAEAEAETEAEMLGTALQAGEEAPSIATEPPDAAGSYSQANEGIGLWFDEDDELGPEFPICDDIYRISPLWNF